MHFLDGWIVGAIHRSESAVASDAALEFFRYLLQRAFFERVGATGEKNGSSQEESDREGFQARTLLKKVTCYK